MHRYIFLNFKAFKSKCLWLTMFVCVINALCSKPFGYNLSDPWKRQTHAVQTIATRPPLTPPHPIPALLLAPLLFFQLCRCPCLPARSAQLWMGTDYASRSKSEQSKAENHCRCIFLPTLVDDPISVLSCAIQHWAGALVRGDLKASCHLG